MNRTEFRKNIGARLRLRPLPRIRVGNDSKQWRDIDWILQRIDESTSVAELSAVGFGYTVRIGLDQIHSYMSDPQRRSFGLRYGFLQLRVGLMIDGVNISSEPLRLAS